jgi:hypothetical protein
MARVLTNRSKLTKSLLGDPKFFFTIPPLTKQFSAVATIVYRAITSWVVANCRAVSHKAKERNTSGFSGLDR